MRKNQGKTLIGVMITMLITIFLLPMSVFAATSGKFILVAEADGELIFAPEYVTYTENQTIGEVLENSKYNFIIENGNVMEIKGVSGNFRRSDEDGEFDFAKAASEISHYRFTEEENYTISSGLHKLMTAMAEYLLEETDVQAAAKTEYDTACKLFVGIDNESAQTLAAELEQAVSAYKTALNGTKYTVTVKNDGNVYSDSEIIFENEFGKTWTENKSDGKLSVPAGKYTFKVTKDGNVVSGNLELKADTALNISVPTENWIDTDEFRLSGSYNAVNEEDGLFTDDEFVLGEWSERSITVPVTDTFTGAVYSYIKRADKNITITAEYSVYGKTVYQDIAPESYVSGAANALKRGAVGNTIIYNASKTAKDSYTYTQQYKVILDRIPTLTSITVSDHEGTDQAATEPFDVKKKEYTYKVLSDVSYVMIKGTPLNSDYTVTVNGQNAATDEGAKITLSNAETTVEIKVSYGDYESVYALKFLKGAGQKITFKTASSEVKLIVTNSNDMVMPCKVYKGTDKFNYYQYTLVTEDIYNYVATKNEYFHATDSFSLNDLTSTTITVDVPTENWLTELAFGAAEASTNKGKIQLDAPFSSNKHSYTMVRPDTEYLLFAWCNTNDKNIKIEAIYNQIFASDLYHGKDYTVKITAGQSKGTQIKRILLFEHPQENAFTIRLSKESDGVIYYQDYEVDINRKLSLKDISAKCDGKTATLVQHNGSKGYSTSVTEYDITVPMASQNLSLSLDKYSNTVYGEDENSYRISVNGKNVTATGAADIKLDGTINTQTVSVKIESSQAPTGTTEYVLNILKSPPVEASFNTTPQDSSFILYENLSDERQWENDNGNYQLCEGFSYDYSVTKYGYIGRSGTLNVTRNSSNQLVVTDTYNNENYIVTENGDGGAVTIALSISKAPVNNTIDSSITAYWPDFRGNQSNNGVTDAKIPYKAEQGTLYWANKIGEGFDSGAVGSPIIVDDDIITYAGHTIYRIDTVSGEILATGTMNGASSFAITPPVYAEGMIFVALSDGTVQAFNAKTLESLWIYQDILGGQPNCPITVEDGYLYTGFWVGEKEDASYVCLSITDENPSQSNERKIATWTYACKGGYYWAGACANSNFVLVGTDDGTNACDSQTSRLLMLDAKNGRLLDSWDNLNGDIRSTVVYDEVTDAYYFTSKGGSFYSVKVKQTGNGFEFTDEWGIKLSNGTDGPPMSTCSPAVYNGRAYVGVSGSSQFGAYSGHNITVIDLGSKKIAYSVPTQGYPQTSGLLTTAYEKTSGNVYVYFFDNMTPGKLRVISDKKGQTNANYVITEQGYSGTYTAAYAVFTPVGTQAQYAICSPVADQYGTIYFKNDSAQLMAFGSAIEKIEITEMPEKTTYSGGEIFDPTGMEVTATYVNGTTRDITNYITFNEEPLTAEDTTFTISFEHVMYHNAETGNSIEAGVDTTTPTATLELIVITETLGDVNSDGIIDKSDVQAVLDYEAQNNTELRIETADVSGDGVIDSNDAVLIAQYVAEKITEFPAQEKLEE